MRQNTIFHAKAIRQTQEKLSALFVSLQMVG